MNAMPRTIMDTDTAGVGPQVAAGSPSEFGCFFLLLPVVACSPVVIEMEDDFGLYFGGMYYHLTVF